MPYLYNSIEKWLYPDIVAEQVSQPDLVNLIQHFPSDQCHSDSDSDTTPSSLDTPDFYETICVPTSTVATFYMASDILGIGGMHYKCIHTMDTWKNGPGHYDCVFVSMDSAAEGMHGFDITHVKLLFSFKQRQCVPMRTCALVLMCG